MNSEQFPAPRRGANRSPALSFINLTLLLTCTLAFAVATARMTAISMDASGGDLPRSRENDVKLTLKGEGLVYWNHEEIRPENISQRLKEFAQTTPHGGVIVWATNTARLTEVVALLEEVERHGLKCYVQSREPLKVR